MRDVDPFSYYFNHSSGIPGFGGDSAPPDPRYVFHTDYLDVRRGPASFELQLRGVRSTHGELALRIHAIRPGSDENASLVAGSRVNLAMGDAQDFSISLRFAAQRGVQYAFYGYFLDASDIRADDLRIGLHETEVDEEVYSEPPRSVLASDRKSRDLRPANALIHVITPHLSAPVSQDCTVGQLAEMKIPRHSDRSLGEWSETLCRNALSAYGLNFPALEGLLIGPCSDAFSAALAQSGFAMTRMAADPPPSAGSDVFADFVVWPDGLRGEIDADRRWTIFNAWLGRLKIGGLGVMAVSYRPDSVASRGGETTDTAYVSRKEIGKWALRLIANGYSVAPIAFSSLEDLVLDSDGLAHFIMIVQRQ